MPTPMMGSWTVRVEAARPYAIHGDLYYEVHVLAPDNPSQLVGLRVPQHLMQGAPRVGEVLTVSFLMGQVTGVARAE
jgi:hypothetical protein